MWSAGGERLNERRYQDRSASWFAIGRPCPMLLGRSKNQSAHGGKVFSPVRDQLLDFGEQVQNDFWIRGLLDVVYIDISNLTRPIDNDDGSLGVAFTA